VEFNGSGGSTAQGGSAARGGQHGSGRKRQREAGLQPVASRAAEDRRPQPATGGAKARRHGRDCGSFFGLSSTMAALPSNTGDCIASLVRYLWRQPQTGNITARPGSLYDGHLRHGLATANAILSGFQTVLNANSIRVWITRTVRVPGGRRATRPSSTQPTSQKSRSFWAIGPPQWQTDDV